VSLGGQGRGWLVLAFLLTLPLVTPRIRGADEIETFAYLRSAVFDRDLDFEDEYRWFHARDPEGLRGFKATFLDRREPATGRPINFAPLGSALLWSPFYLLAHAGVAAARALGSAVAADGFSLPYAAAACYASAVYGFLGLLLVHDGLIRYGGFAPGAATAAVATLWLGTPVLYYMTLAPAFSHAAALFMVALVVWLWLRARARPEAALWEWAAVGAAAGVAGLVREQDLLFVAVPAADLAWRAGRGGERPRTLARLIAILVLVPQLLIPLLVLLLLLIAALAVFQKWKPLVEHLRGRRVNDGKRSGYNQCRLGEDEQRQTQRAASFRPIFRHFAGSNRGRRPPNAKRHEPRENVNLKVTAGLTTQRHALRYSLERRVSEMPSGAAAPGSQPWQNRPAPARCGPGNPALRFAFCCRAGRSARRRRNHAGPDAAAIPAARRGSARAPHAARPA